MEGWKARHPTWEYRLWTDADASSELASLPSLAEAFRTAGNPAEKSDLLRLAIVFRHGGLYVDVDFECLQAVESLHRHSSFYTGLSNVGAFELNNGLFAAAPGHAILQYLVEHVGRPWPEWGEADVEPGEAVAYQLGKSGMLGSLDTLAPSGKAAFLATTGPGFFTRAVMRAVLRSASQDSKQGQEEAPAAMMPNVVFPPEVFYPLSNAQRRLDKADRSQHALPTSLAMHHWFRTWGEIEGLPADSQV